MNATAKYPIGKLHIELALSADGAYPDSREARLACITLGPHGLLRLLESQLGIPDEDASFTARLVQYLACVESVGHPGAFYYRSYQADPFSVARNLLQWRDAWYLAGWTGTFSAQAPPRLADMAEIEKHVGDAVAPGFGERLRRVTELLGCQPVAIESIALLDPLPAFPAMWRHLLDALGAHQQVAITGPPSPQAAARPDTDLGRLQRGLLDPSCAPIELSGDDSLRVLRSAAPAESGPLLAQLLQRRQLATPENSIAVLAEARGSELDDSLEGENCPRLGFGALSPWRPVFQVLPLALELLWSPLNLTALFQFLSHPVGPLPRRLRARLAATVADTPGIGSSAWQETLENGLATEASEQRDTLRARAEYWLQAPRFQPETGVDSATLAERAHRVADWLRSALETSDDPAQQTLYRIAYNQAVEFGNAVDRLRKHGRDPLTRDNVRRLVDDVRGNGATATDRDAEVTPGRAPILPAGHAGAFTTAIDHVIWWDCQATDRVRAWPWSAGERRGLLAAGVELQDEDAQWDWLAQAWLRPVVSARKELILILHEDAERRHPVYEQLSCIAPGLTAQAVDADSTVEGLGLSREPLAHAPLPALQRWWQLPDGTPLTDREFESYSSLDAYLYSPYQWLLRYCARVQAGSLGAVSDGNLLKGNLAHRLFQQYFDTHPAPLTAAGKDIICWVDRELPRLLGEEGALLLEAGRQAECQRFIVQSGEALVALVEHLRAAEVEQVAMEEWQEGEFDGGGLQGSIDLLATRADGNEAVVDIKWGGRRYRRDALLADRYLQLAVYHHLRREQTGRSPALSYFIVNDAHMLSLDHAFFPHAEIIERAADGDSTDYWRQVESLWRWRRQQLERGLVEVTVAGTEPDARSEPPPDGPDLPATSDDFNEYWGLTGWEQGA